MVQGDHSVRLRDQTKIVCRIPRLISPKSVQFRLTYPDPQIARTRTTAGVANWSLRGSGFDPDPALGTGAIPGYSEWARFYNFYRIVGIGVRGSITHTELFPVALAIWPYSGTLIANNTLVNPTAVYDIEANPLALNYVMSQSTAGPIIVHLNNHWTYSEILGDDKYLLDDNFASSVGTNPVETCQILFAIAGMTGVNFVTGALTNIQFDIDIEFYGRINLTS
jgi:hypothetical protein